MQKTYIIAVSITLGLLTLCIGIYFLFFHQKPIWDIETNITSDIPLSYEAQRLKIEQHNQQDTELYNRALQNQNIELCVAIANTEKQTECKDMIRATTAKKSGTIEICDSLTSTGVITLCRDAISSDRAISTQDRTICNHISGTDRRSYCKEQVDALILRGHIESHTVTREFCMTLSEKYQTNCIQEVQQVDNTTLYHEALAKNDAKICEQITQTELGNTCRDTIHLKTAITTNNSTPCDTISDSTKRLYCQTQVSKTNDITLYTSAISGTDIDACTPIKTVNLRTKCHDSIIISRVRTEKNPALCTSLTNTGIIHSCQQIVQ